MDGIACGEPLHWHCALTPLNHTLLPPPPPPPPPPLPGAQAALYLPFPLLIALVVLAIWFRPHLAPPGQQFLAGAEGMRPPPPAQPPQIRLRIAGEQEQPLPVIVVWDADRLAAMVGAILHSLNAQIRPPLPRRPRRSAESSDSDSDPSSSDDEKNQLRSLDASTTKYPSIADLDAGHFPLIVPTALLRLQEVLAGSPEAARFDVLPRICPRFSDVIENQWILHDYSAFTDLCDEWVLVCKLIITTKLLCEMWCQLDKQNWQFCQELKKAYFAHVSDACINALLEVASSFSNDRIEQMVPIFDILVDAVCNIRDISFTRSEFINNKVADIFHYMVNAFRGQLENRSDESASANCHLVQALKFFHRNTDVQAILGTRDHIIDLVDRWAAKLKKDAQQDHDEKDRQYIYILNKMYVVRQMWCRPEGFLCKEQVGRIDSLIQHNIDGFLNGYWILVQKYLEGDSLRDPCHSSLNKFIGELDSKCDEQMTWQVATELKIILRKGIPEIVIPPYQRFLLALEETPSPANFCIKQFFLRNRMKKKVIDRSEELRNMFENLFER